MPRIDVKISLTLVVITTCKHENWPWPWQTGGTGEPGTSIAGERTLTLLVNPVVALQPGPLTSNQVLWNEVELATSQAVENTVPKPLMVAKSCATRTGVELLAGGPLRLPDFAICLAAASVAKSAAFWAFRLVR